ncbi:uncharacterized protein PAC_01901 [Phialocephala subalpina]|uniref:tRNA(Ile)-lysidine synthetase n=1 Tax=Phialocephala subalpina TaxID=576137 RepID=A0A1L7WGW7_9HELO|nr:uncharacterized protein PAC_01901 [Phialocephala subalpina]
MGSISNALGSSARHITTLEFAKSLARVIRIGKSSFDGRRQHFKTVGLAISGGVDSMALAALCSNIQNLPHVKPEMGLDEIQLLKYISFKAFIVDHQVRPGSEEEANAVSNILEGRGIKSEVLKIHWSEAQKPAALSNFETVARKHRFRLLGKACKDSGINSLLLAHHEDDQVETVMMRMLAGHRRSGLVGIKESAGIPECYGMHGVYESGGLDKTPSKMIPEEQKFLPKLSSTSVQLQIERGGIKIYRPMLAFSKARLIATCQHEKMEWFEDHTNKDPTLTKRNAIRHMYNSHAIPTALTKPAILALCQRSQDSLLRQDAVVDSLVAKCVIKTFNTRTGTVTVRFPEVDLIFRATADSEIDCGRVAAEMLRRILFLVSPEEHIELASLQGTVRYMFPGLFETGLEGFKQALLKPFTVASVLLQPMVPKVPGQERKAHLLDEPETEQKSQPLWLLSRQPYSLLQQPPSMIIPPTENVDWTPWTLYDGRYWIRVMNRSRGVTMNIRPFFPEDMRNFQSSLEEPHQRKFNRVLKAEASGDMRWTLPSLSSRTTDSEEDVILALPTLGFYGQKTEADSLVRWEVRYKKVDLTGLSIDPPGEKKKNRKARG